MSEAVEVKCDERGSGSVTRGMTYRDLRLSCVVITDVPTYM